jgi:hypothetical protein
MCSQAARCVFRRIVSAGARFNPRSLRRVSSVDAGIDPRTQATITTISRPLCEESTSEGFVVGSFGFDGLFNAVFEAVSDVYQRVSPCMYWGCSSSRLI